MQCVRAYVRESKVFVAMVLILIFSEVLGLYGYGFIVAAVFIQRVADTSTGQTHRCTDNEYQNNGRKVFMTYATVSMSPALHDLRLA